MFRNFYLVRDRRRIASPPCTALWDFLVSKAEGKSPG